MKLFHVRRVVPAASQTVTTVLRLRAPCPCELCSTFKNNRSILLIIDDDGDNDVDDGMRIMAAMMMTVQVI